MKNISEINTNTIDGRYLIAALSILTVQDNVVILKEDFPASGRTSEEMLEQLDKVQKQIFEEPLPENVVEERPTFLKALETLINQYSMENGSNTPDFILAEYMMHSLATFEKATQQRELWYGFERTPAWRNSRPNQIDADHNNDNNGADRM